MGLMTTATRSAIEQLQRLSAAELAELRVWLNAQRPDPTSSAARSTLAPDPRRPDFAADLRESWGDAPPMAENAVLAMRAEERA